MIDTVALEVWAVVGRGGRLRSYTLCREHSLDARAEQESMNRALAEKGLRVLRMEIPEGAAIHVDLAGRRCAVCFGDPPDSPVQPRDRGGDA